MTIAPLRLPGVTFQVVPPTPQTVLPRMDIAAFVGLAAAGPLHTPVAVEDPPRFRDLFGPDLTLALDTETGRVQSSYLGRAVEAFFRNGGRRCWVVRVADATAATTSRFVIPGLVEAGRWLPAVARARSAGGWADQLCTGAVENVRWLDVLDLSIDLTGNGSAAYQLEVRVPPGELQVGDLIRCWFKESNLLLFLPVLRVTQEADRQILHASENCIWLQIAEPGSPPQEPLKAVHRGGAGEAEVPFGPDALALDSSGAVVQLDIPLTQAPQPGDLVAIEFADGTTGLVPVSGTALIETGSPQQAVVEVQGPAIFQPLTTEEGMARYHGSPQSADGSIQAERVRFALWVWEAQEVRARMEMLGFHARHPRYWAGLPTDEGFFRVPATRPQGTPPTLAQEAAESPRFPLAGPAFDPKVPPLFLPLGMLTLPDLSTCRSPFWPAGSGSRLVRDGLEKFGSELFLDPNLDRARLSTLTAEADHRQYVLGEDLQGIHTLLAVEEATLVAVPDAVHFGWREDTPDKPSVLPPPYLGTLSPPETETLAWSIVPGATGYTLECASEPMFAAPELSYSGPETQIDLDVPTDCPETRYFRVAAYREGEQSPWSNTWVLPPQLDFQPCDLDLLEAPYLETIQENSPPSNRLLVGWSAVEGAEGYELQEGERPRLQAGQTLHTGPERAVQVLQRKTPVTYYRVRAFRGKTFSPWSNTRWFVAPPETRFELTRNEDYPECNLFDIQRALLRMCAARGDLFAILTLPHHYGSTEARGHRAGLVWTAGPGGDAAKQPCRLPALNPGERVALGYGAMYHPWIANQMAEVPASDGRSPWTPPDGAIAGTFAKRALERGAWIAPANEPLTNVIALAEAIDRDEWAALLGEQINILREDPRGYMVLSAVTLHPHPEYRPINVRRLLILLRRLAFREGMRFVFQNNEPVFRRLVRSQFETVLADLFSQGAFKGSIPEEAYQVNTELPTTPQDQARGRLIVELRVAPSRPMSFITIRLLQQGDEGLQIEEG